MFSHLPFWPYSSCTDEKLDQWWSFYHIHYNVECNPVVIVGLGLILSYKKESTEFGICGGAQRLPQCKSLIVIFFVKTIQQQLCARKMTNYFSFYAPASILHVFRLLFWHYKNGIRRFGHLLTCTCTCPDTFNAHIVARTCFWTDWLTLYPSIHSLLS